MKILHTADWHIGQFKGPVVDGVNLRLQGATAINLPGGMIFPSRDLILTSASAEVNLCVLVL